jgi:hypothetical protein
MPARGIPVVFAAPRSLRVLNTVAVSTALAACTSAVFMHLIPGLWTWAIIAGLPTLVTGAAWIALLRWKKASPVFGVRWGWLASVPLAALNSALACGAVSVTDNSNYLAHRFTEGMAMGATFGAILWLPALLAVLVVFGVPIAHAQKLAQRGLVGEDRGEQIIGLVSAALGAVALVVAWAFGEEATFVPFFQSLPNTQPADRLGFMLLHLFALLAMLSGAITLVEASQREARRRRFVARAAANEEPGFRVDDTEAGMVLLRVQPEASYRVAAGDEEVFELDILGRALRPSS